jgi:hypothetical protein
MDNLTITRFAYTPIGTFGSAMVGGLQLYSCEPPWLDNRPVISCIPEGTYTCRPATFIHGGYQAIEITAVPGRTGILFHIGNTRNDTKGCILLGFELGCMSGLWAVLSSHQAFDHFMSLYGQSPFELTIKRLPLLSPSLSTRNEDLEHRFSLPAGNPPTSPLETILNPK